MTEAEILLKDYVEGRFDRLTTSIDEKIKLQSCELKELITADDTRYQQRFEAQGKALDAAFGAAKEAVNAALAGADKAAVKTEQTADKRFADLGELIKEQFKGIGDKIEALALRVNGVETRLNSHIDEASGGEKSQKENKGLWAFIIVVAMALLTLWNTFK